MKILIFPCRHRKILTKLYHTMLKNLVSTCEYCVFVEKFLSSYTKELLINWIQFNIDPFGIAYLPLMLLLSWFYFIVLSFVVVCLFRLGCSVTYCRPSGEKLHFKKFFKFQVFILSNDTACENLLFGMSILLTTLYYLLGAKAA